MGTQRYTLTLPEEPPVGAIAVLSDGACEGTRFQRVCEGPTGWRRIYPQPNDDFAVSWSFVWWSVTEDGAGGTRVDVTIPDPDDPHPRPWHAGVGVVLDALGLQVPVTEIVRRVNGDEVAPSEYRELLGSIWLYVPWQEVTHHLTTEQKELWADAVDATADSDHKVDRWWRE